MSNSHKTPSEIEAENELYQFASKVRNNKDLQSLVKKHGVAAFSSDLGSRIRQARVAARLRQDEFAIACHTSQSMVSDWENNKRTPSSEAIERIATVTGRSAEEFTENL